MVSEVMNFKGQTTHNHITCAYHTQPYEQLNIAHHAHYKSASVLARKKTLYKLQGSPILLHMLLCTFTIASMFF